MFDDGTKIGVFAIVMAAWVFGLSADKLEPPADLATAVDHSQLPPLPLKAAPDGSPVQARVPGIQVALSHGFEAKLLASYVLEGRVVTRREYRNDLTSPISPLDLGIVWGDLAPSDATNGFEFRTMHRAIWFNPPKGVDLSWQWDDQITNNHLIPATPAVNNALMAVAIGDRVRLRGYLVTVTGNGILQWRSSTRRDDRGCEIILVTSVEVLTKDETTT
jgi:hypothetical protein